jgi:hypothetical protein
VLRDARVDVVLGEAEVVARNSVAGDRQPGVEVQQVLGRPAGYADPSRGGPPIRGAPAGEVGITSHGGIEI